ncbi:basic salivary proline-rich protein 2-like [Folsomia candida]|nr:basic salivary proline-rich protein 2-like [Folsomia candida]
MACSDNSNLSELENLPNRSHSPLPQNRDAWVSEALDLFYKEFNYVDVCPEKKAELSNEKNGKSCCCDFTQLTKFMQQQIQLQLQQQQQCGGQQSGGQQCCGQQSGGQQSGGQQCGGQQSGGQQCCGQQNQKQQCPMTNTEQNACPLNPPVPPPPPAPASICSSVQQSQACCSQYFTPVAPVQPPCQGQGESIARPPQNLACPNNGPTPNFGGCCGQRCGGATNVSNNTACHQTPPSTSEGQARCGCRAAALGTKSNHAGVGVAKCPQPPPPPPPCPPPQATMQTGESPPDPGTQKKEMIEGDGEEDGYGGWKLKDIGETDGNRGSGGGGGGKDGEERSWALRDIGEVDANRGGGSGGGGGKDGEERSWALRDVGEVGPTSELGWKPMFGSRGGPPGDGNAAQKGDWTALDVDVQKPEPVNVSVVENVQANAAVAGARMPMPTNYRCCPPCPGLPTAPPAQNSSNNAVNDLPPKCETAQEGTKYWI